MSESNQNPPTAKERPILFSGPMVRAILEGRKTQTRRVVTPQPEIRLTGYDHGHWSVRCPHGAKGSSRSGECGVSFGGSTDLGGEWEYLGRFSDGYHRPIHGPIRCPHGVPGDRLWVRETFGILSFGGSCAQIRYAADGKQAIVGDSKLPNRIKNVQSIHMPRNVCRITLEITDVRVQRLKDISEEDIIAEGCDGDYSWASGAARCDASGDLIQNQFESLWISINGIESWEANPWVWAITFKVLTK